MKAMLPLKGQAFMNLLLLEKHLPFIKLLANIAHSNSNYKQSCKYLRGHDICNIAQG